jgi:hypothetical protein
MLLARRSVLWVPQVRVRVQVRVQAAAVFGRGLSLVRVERETMTRTSHETRQRPDQWLLEAWLQLLPRTTRVRQLLQLLQTQLQKLLQTRLDLLEMHSWIRFVQQQRVQLRVQTEGTRFRGKTHGLQLLACVPKMQQ